MPAPLLSRRSALLATLAGLGTHATRPLAQPVPHPSPRWFEAAESMRQRALSWGDQSYGAVVVVGESLVGEGPSRVVRDRDADAHAERVAIRDAQRRLGRADLAGAILYSTSRPCAACEHAAARAGVERMYFGSGLTDAGPPRTQPR
jgi:tRNA(Arg) A34 adenosine deaminase TadA